MSSQKVLGNFGRLWGRGYEPLTRNLRRILSIKGPSATTYLQGLVTSDLTSFPSPPRPEALGAPEPGVPEHLQRSKSEEYGHVEFTDVLRATCFLDHRGRILTDSLLWKLNDEEYYIDVPESTANILFQHLKQYKLRRTKVTIDDATDRVQAHVIYGTLNAKGTPPGILAALDPRHPSLGLRTLQILSDESTSSESSSSEPPLDFAKLMARAFPLATGNYELVRRLAGVAEGAELTGKVALEANQEFLNAVSFAKGCYLGQELTARVQHTGTLRKRVLPLLVVDTTTQIPQAWTLASSLQRGQSLGRFTRHELETLPTRQPRLSVAGAANFVSLLSGSVQPSQPAVDEGAKAEWDQFQAKAQTLVENLHRACAATSSETGDESSSESSKDDESSNSASASPIVMTDVETGKTVGHVVSPPVPGTNVINALVRLQDMGLQGDKVWQPTNKVKIGSDETEFRLLPYLPLWWPELNLETGKAAEPKEEDEDEDVYIEPAGFQVPRQSMMEIEKAQPLQENQPMIDPREGQENRTPNK